ncbi:hypothetical protein LX36DRAFT_754672, partial [Colletotrichum falcatum]
MAFAQRNPFMGSKPGGLGHGGLNLGSRGAMGMPGLQSSRVEEPVVEAAAVVPEDVKQEAKEPGGDKEEEEAGQPEVPV